MKRNNTYKALVVATCATLAATLGAAPLMAQEDQSRENPSQRQGQSEQQESKTGKIVTLNSYLGIAAATRSTWSEQQQQRGQTDSSFQDEGSQQERDSGRSSSDEFSSPERDPAQRDPSQTERQQGQQQSRQQQYGAAERSQMGQHSEHLVLVTKEGGLFGGGEKVYLLVFDSHASMSQSVQQKAQRLAQSGSVSGAISTTDDPSQQQREQQQVRGDRESSAQQGKDVKVTGRIITKGGLNAIQVSQIDENMTGTDTESGSQRKSKSYQDDN